MSKFRALLLVTTLIPLAACGPTDVASPGEGTIVTPPAPPRAAAARRRPPAAASRPRAARPATIDRGLVGTGRRACELPPPLHRRHHDPEPAGRRLFDFRPGQCRHRLRRRSRRAARRLPAGRRSPSSPAPCSSPRPATTIWWSTAARGSTRSAPPRAPIIFTARANITGHHHRFQPGPVGRHHPARPRPDQRLQHRRPGRLGHLPAGDRGHDQLALRRRLGRTTIRAPCNMSRSAIRASRSRRATSSRA